MSQALLRVRMTEIRPTAERTLDKTSGGCGVRWCSVRRQCFELGVVFGRVRLEGGLFSLGVFSARKRSGGQREGPQNYLGIRKTSYPVAEMSHKRSNEEKNGI